MSDRPEIGLGDLATVLGAMGLLAGGSVEEAQRVARVLGLRSRDDAATATGSGAGDLVIPASSETTVTAGREVASPAPPPPAPATSSGATAVALAITPGARPTVRARAPGERLPAPPDRDAADTPPPLEPLFSPASSRSLIAAALATWQPDGAIDVARLVHRVASRRPILRVPRQPRLGLRFGVQVLVDHGAGMDPFVRDAAALIAQLRAIAGAHRVEVLRFAGDPLVAGRGPRRTWRDYPPPEAGARVIAVSDLGIAAPRLRLPAPSASWRALADRIAAARGSLLCVVPYPPARWPRELAGALTIVAWDRATTVGQVRHLLRGRR